VAAGAAKASAKAVGVVVDDTAVTPRYVQGFTPDRELPVVWKIARGSIINKLVFILPAILLLSQFLPWLLTPLLMCGGLYLSYEGAEKLWEAVSGHSKAKEAPALLQGGDHEKLMVSSAIRTDFILSAEIMVISLNEVGDLGFWMRAGSLIVVALIITAMVYGVVALIVKMDDVGLKLAAKERTRHAMGRRTHPARRHQRPRLHADLRIRPPPRGGCRARRGRLCRVAGEHVLLRAARRDRRRGRGADHAPPPLREEGPHGVDGDPRAGRQELRCIARGAGGSGAGR